MITIFFGIQTTGGKYESMAFSEVESILDNFINDKRANYPEPEWKILIKPDGVSFKAEKPGEETIRWTKYSQEEI